MQAQLIIENLQKQIDYHQNLYDDPELEVEISDPDFDLLKVQLKVFAPDDHRLNHVAGVSMGKHGFHRAKVSHGDNPCYSQDKVYSFAEILEFASKVSRNEEELFDIEIKYDGLTGSLSGDVLSTSGEDGLEGFDISDKLDIINIEYAPGTENITKDLRGEIVIKKSIFDANRELFVRKSSGKPYKFPRSACVAQVMGEDHIQSLGKFLSFVIFGRHQKTISLADLRSFDWDKFAEQVRQMDYPCDGLVLKLNDRQYLDSLGATSHHKRGEMSFKFANIVSEPTVVLDILRCVGKRKITPLAIVQPVDLDGSTTSRCTLHHLDNMRAKDVAIGDKILLMKCGQIIPGLHSVVDRPANRIKIESGICPACNQPTEFDGKFEMCLNDNCCGTSARKLYDSVVRMGIEGLGLTTVQKIIAQHQTDNMIELFNLDFSQIVTLEGFATKSAKKVVNNVLAVKNAPIEDWKILASLNISGIGRRMSKKILTNNTIVDLQKLSTAELLLIDGIGDIRAPLIRITLEEQSSYLNNLISLFPSIINTADQQKSIKGTVCFTGKTPVKTESRKNHWEPFAEQNGFEVSKTVTKNTNFLVTGDLNSNSSKMKKAKVTGVTILDYDGFRSMCG